VLGISGISSDFRDLEKQGMSNERASLALEALITVICTSALMLLLSMVWMQLYLRRCRRKFRGGTGSNSFGLTYLGIEIDKRPITQRRNYDFDSNSR
jgi:acetate kinase